nr:unnamed protein product [Digitaria exilis]CAB3498882.1 unnamed protein product [Digitaria exilis]
MHRKKKMTGLLHLLVLGRILPFLSPLGAASRCRCLCGAARYLSSPLAFLAPSASAGTQRPGRRGARAMTSSSSPSRKPRARSPPDSIDLSVSLFVWVILAALSKIAASRLQKELAEWQVNPPAGFKHRVTDNLQRCYSPSLAALSAPLLTEQIPSRGHIRLLTFVHSFPCDSTLRHFVFLHIRLLTDPHCVALCCVALRTLYTGETYQLQVDFPEHYPMEAPQVTDNDRYVRNCRNGRSPKETSVMGKMAFPSCQQPLRDGTNMSGSTVFSHSPFFLFPLCSHRHGEG